MKPKKHYFIHSGAITIISFTVIIFFIWINEIFDLPHTLLNAQRTPINIKEAAFETGFIIAIYFLIEFVRKKLIGEIKYLKGFYSICAYCKKVKVGDQWISLESFLDQESDAKLSHGICPDCLQKEYDINL